jgi:hypothetical protein
MSSTTLTMIDLIDHLEPSPKRERDKYICPVCGGHNLSIAKSGKYQCFGAGCDTKEIFKATLAIAGIEGNREDYDREREQRRLEREQADRERIAKLPSLARRDFEISRKLKLGYSGKHLQLLIERGFTRDQIDWHGFYSSHGAIGCAVRDLDRRCVSVVRRMDEKRDGTRYLWSKEYSKLPAESVAPDQLPIAVATPYGRDIEPGVVCVCESSAIKVNLASERLKALTIGVGGSSGSLDRIRSQIEAIAPQIKAKYGWDEIEWRILPDAGYRVNPGVNEAVNSLVDILTPFGTVTIGDWGQGFDKAVGDIDEIDPDRLKTIQWLLAEKHKLSAPADARINQRYLDPSIAGLRPAGLIPRDGFVFFQSPKKSGKSKALLTPIIKQHEFKRVLSVVQTVGLGQEQAAKFGLQAHDSVTFERARLPGKLHVWTTIDSAAKLLRSMQGCELFDLIILDECRSDIEHLHTAKTDIGKNCNRAKGIEAVEIFVREAELVIAADADDMTDEREWLTKADPTKSVFTIINDAMPEPITYRSWGNRQALETQVIEVATNTRDRILVFADSQKQCEALHIEIERLNPNRKILRIDKKLDPKLRAEIMVNPERWMVENGIDTLIYSPSIVCGVSFEMGLFQHHFAFACGVIEPTKFRQGLARDRLATQWDIWAKEESYLSDHAGVNPNEVIANLKAKNEFGATIREHAIELATERVSEDGYADIDDVLAELNRMQEQGWDKDRDLMYFAKCVARSNLARANNKLILFHELREIEGATIVEHQADSPEDDPLELAKDEITENDTDLTLEGVQSLLELAPEDVKQTVESARATLNDRNATHDDFMKARGVILKDDLPGFNIDRDFIADKVIGDRQWLGRARLRWLMENPNIARTKDARSIAFLASTGKASPQDLKLWESRIKLLAVMGIPNWIDHTESFAIGHPDVTEFAAIAKKHAKQLREIFGVTHQPKRPIATLSKLLTQIGVKLTSKKTNGTRSYRLAQEDPAQREIITALGRKWDADQLEIEAKKAEENREKMARKNKNAKMAETLTVYQKRQGHDPQIYYKQIGGDVPVQNAPVSPAHTNPISPPTPTPISSPDPRWDVRYFAPTQVKPPTAIGLAEYYADLPIA